MNSEAVYSEQKEGLRVIDTGKSKYKIILDRSTGMWHVETDVSQLPVALRNRVYTSHKYAATDIKNYLDGHTERQIIYRKGEKKKED